jgi:hypothetical protein
MAVGIRNSFRENWALFSAYDTMPPSVRILLPSTTSTARLPLRESLVRGKADGGFNVFLGETLLTTELMECGSVIQGIHQAKGVRTLLS